MKNIRLLLLPLALAGACQQSTKTETHPQATEVTPVREVKQYTIEQFMSNPKFGGSSFSHDGKRVAYHSNESGIYNMYARPVEGGEPEQLTNSTTESNYLISFFPNDSRLLYAADQGGNELSHIYLRNEDGTTRDLTPGKAKSPNFMDWSHDKKSFYYVSNVRDARSTWTSSKWMPPA